MAEFATGLVHFEFEILKNRAAEFFKPIFGSKTGILGAPFPIFMTGF